jgi:hypothetical protein
MCQHAFRELRQLDRLRRSGNLARVVLRKQEQTLDETTQLVRALKYIANGRTLGVRIVGEVETDRTKANRGQWCSDLM